MMFTTEMVQLFAVVLRKDCDCVTESLLREGVMQFISTSEAGGEKTGQFTPVKSEASFEDIRALRQRVEGLFHTIGMRPPTPSESDLKHRAPVDVEKERKQLDTIEARRAGIRERQRTIQQEVLRLEDIRRQVGLYGLGLPDAALSPRHSFLEVQTGTVPAAGKQPLEENLSHLPSLTLELGREGDTFYYLLISLKRDREQVHRILAGVGWNEVELPTELKSVKEDASKELSVKLAALTAEQKKLQTEADNLIREVADELQQLWIKLRVNELLFRVQSHFASSSRTVIFMGWLPSSKRQRLTDAIKKASEGHCYLEWHEPTSTEVIGDEVPVRFNNPRLLAPFQMLVSNFGIPRYGTIDPTPFVMPIYLAMFGLMFADVGQGFVLVLLGVLGVRFLRRNEGRSSWYRLSWLIVWCGLSSVAFGIAFGSIFGMALFRPLWFDFHGAVLSHGPEGPGGRTVFDVLSVAVYFGIAVIALGLIFNWVNIIRARRWMELVFDKGGILGGWIYAGGIYVAFYLITHDYKAFPSGGALLGLVGLPALLLFLKEPYHYLKHGGGRERSGQNPVFAVFNFVMEWLVGLLEIFSGYLSNTLSFMRVAGLGIAHVCLMLSFFTLAAMTEGVFSFLILVVGNVLVIALEGLSAGIQALRLSYYEFFTKFFHGTGKLYTPISLASES